MANSNISLLREKRFLPFFITQFLGAFNDNIYKNTLLIIIAFQLANANTLTNLAAALFIFPFFLFSAFAGQLADKYEKSALMRKIKAFEIFVMCFAACAFYFDNTQYLLGVLFLMGTQSSFFGPVKFAIIPQHLKEHELVAGNGIVEGGTFIAILLGTIIAGPLIQLENSTRVISVIVIVLAILGWFSSQFIPEASASDKDLKLNYNLFTQTWRTLKIASEQRVVFLSILGISWFWALGAVYLTQFPSYAKNVIGDDESVVSVLLAMFTVGISIGSLLCSKLSADRVELGLVPFGSIGMCAFGIDLFFAGSATFTGELQSASDFFANLLADGSYLRVMIDLMLIGVFAGLYVVPLQAIIQQQSNPRYRSRIIAGNNILNSLFMVSSALFSILFFQFSDSIPHLFLCIALLNIVAAAYIYSLVPLFLIRFIVWILINTMYRVKEKNIANIPHSGAAVVVCNHVSFVDPLIIAACSPRPTRFIMDHNIFKNPFLSWFFKTIDAIPIAPKHVDAAIYHAAFDAISDALDNNQLVCIFPEGKITYSGEMNEFKDGIEKIIQRNPVPVTPLALKGLWGSFFSRKDGRAMSSVPVRFFSKIGIVAGDTVAAEDVTASLLFERVQTLRGDAL